MFLEIGSSKYHAIAFASYAVLRVHTAIPTCGGYFVPSYNMVWYELNWYSKTSLRLIAVLLTAAKFAQAASS